LKVIHLGVGTPIQIINGTLLKYPCSIDWMPTICNLVGYRPEEDPYEKKNLAQEHPEILQQLQKFLKFEMSRDA